MTEAQRQHYEECLRQGTSHVLAEMFALAQPPMSNTDREFLQGRENGRQFEKDPRSGDFYAAEAKKHGVNPKGKVYMASLAEYPGDHMAWVSGRGDIQRRCEERGWGCEGTVNMPVRNVAEPAKIGLAADIVDEQVQQVLAREPEPARVDVVDLREQIKDKMTPYFSK